MALELPAPTNLQPEDAAVGVFGMYQPSNISKHDPLISFPENDSPYPEVRSAVANIDDPHKYSPSAPVPNCHQELLADLQRSPCLGISRGRGSSQAVDHGSGQPWAQRCEDSQNQCRERDRSTVGSFQDCFIWCSCS